MVLDKSDLMEVFPYGLVKSRTSKLIKLGGYYFVTDYWSSSRYPCSKEGLLQANEHIKINKSIDLFMKGCLE